MSSDSKFSNSISLKVFAGICMLVFAALYFWHMLDVRNSINGCGDTFLLRDYILLGAWLFISCIICLYLCLIRRAEVRIIFAVSALLVGLSGIFVFRGLSAPDEVSHYISAYRLSNVIMCREAADGYGRAYIRSCDMFLEDTEGRIDEVRAAADRGDDSVDMNLKVFGQQLDESVYAAYAGKTQTGNGNKTDTGISCQWTVNTTPLAYLPQALGITAARLAGAGPLGLITLGKLFNLIFYIAVITAAIGLMPGGGEILAGAALIPMSMHLAGSMSYDVFVISMSFLFIALVLRLKDKQEKAGVKDIIPAAAVLALLGPCKMVYSFLILFLLLLIPEVRAGRFRLKTFAALVSLSFIFLAVSMYLVNRATITDYAAADERIISWAEEAQGYTLSYIIHRPLETVRIFYNSFLMMSGNWFSTMFGIYLGNQDPVLNVPYPLIGIFAVGLMLLAAGSEFSLGGIGKLAAAGTFLAVFGALMGSMLIAYTPLSSPYIEGVQGRYLLPVLPLALMCIPGRWISLKRSLSHEIIWLFVLLDAYVLVRVFATVCLRL